MSYHAVSLESAHNTDQAGLRQSEINIFMRFFSIDPVVRNCPCKNGAVRVCNQQSSLTYLSILFDKLITMTQVNSDCPLCISSEIFFFCGDKLRDYLCCRCCGMVFVPKQFHLTPEAEKAQYDLHENTPDDQGYRRFLGRLIDPLIQRLVPASQGLDFGCGPGPCLSVMLEEQGHSMSLYDLYYADNRALLAKEYDFITATEVVEHLFEPAKELQQLWGLLKPGGYLGLMTKLVTDAEKFANWHYKTDPTHISFFSVQSFEYLGEQWGSKPVFIDADVIIFQKPL